MSMGIPYDSDAGRGIAGALTSLLTGQAFATSAAHGELHRAVRWLPGERRTDAAASCGCTATPSIASTPPARNTCGKPRARSGTKCVDSGRQYGFRNSQATVLAPTGTIAFMMDCDTTGIEPDIALVKYKQLAGGGMLKIVNRTVPLALKSLALRQRRVTRIIEHIESRETIEGSADLKFDHLPVLRLCVQGPERHADDSVESPHPHDGRRAAVPLRGDFQDRQHAGRVDRGRCRAGLLGRLAARSEGARDLSRRLEAKPTAGHDQRRRPQEIAETV